MERSTHGLSPLNLTKFQLSFAVHAKMMTIFAEPPLNPVPEGHAQSQQFRLLKRGCDVESGT